MINASLINFLAMGGYAFYVWISYGMVFVVLFALLITSIRHKRAVLKKLNHPSSQPQYCGAEHAYKT